MRPPTAPKKFSLQLHIITLFTVLILISGGLLGWYSYSQLSKSMINGGKILFSNSSSKVIDKISSESEHIHAMLKLLNVSKLTEISNKQNKIDRLPVLSEILNNTPSLSALFLAYPNNDFFLYRKIQSNTILDKYGAPEQSHFMMTLRMPKLEIVFIKSLNGLKKI